MELCTEAALALVMLLFARPATADWPALASGPLQDNSFLVEEAYNQDEGVVQHIVSGTYDRRTGDWTATYTQEWPAWGVTHQLSFTVPFQWAAGPGAGRGVGDVLLNYRYQLLKDEGRRPAMAPRVSLILPTGSFKEGLGNGSAGVQLLLPVSKQFNNHWAGHVNLGVTVVPHARVPEAPPRSESLTSWNGGASLIWEPVDAINLLGEFVASRDEEIEGRGVADKTRATFNPGVRVGWNGPGGVQWVWGLAFPIGLTRDTDAFGVFLYFSAEHAVTAKAQANRQW